MPQKSEVTVIRIESEFEGYSLFSDRGRELIDKIQINGQYTSVKGKMEIECLDFMIDKEHGTTEYTQLTQPKRCLKIEI